MRQGRNPKKPILVAELARVPSIAVPTEVLRLPLPKIGMLPRFGPLLSHASEPRSGAVQFAPDPSSSRIAGGLVFGTPAADLGIQIVTMLVGQRHFGI